MNTPMLSKLRERLNSLSDTNRLRVTTTFGFVVAVSMSLFLWFYLDQSPTNFWQTTEGLIMIRSLVVTALLFVMLLVSLAFDFR